MPLNKHPKLKAIEPQFIEIAANHGYFYKDKVHQLSSEDKILYEAVQLLQHKKKENRSEEDLNRLMKATMHMDFFKKINKKKSNQEGNLHWNLCRAMEHQFFPKGSVVFYQGDIPDSFFILLEGRACVLTLLPAEEMSQRAKQQKESDKEQGLKLGMRRYLVVLSFQRAIKRLVLALFFIKASARYSKQQFMGLLTKGQQKIGVALKKEQTSISELLKKIETQQQVQAKYCVRQSTTSKGTKGSRLSGLEQICEEEGRVPEQQQ